MPIARPDRHGDVRVVAHVDLDCFYVQVEQRKDSALLGKPTAVVQYNSWKGGGLIAVGYEARQFGVKRSMRGDEAKKLCPDINLVQVPVSHEKADLTIYRDAGTEVVNILARTGRCERASIDEVYLDITEAALTRHSQRHCVVSTFNQEAFKTHIVGLADDGEVEKWLCANDGDYGDQLLACGAFIIAEIRMAVLAETQFTCSAGIAHNKMLAKLASGMHKPSQQTVISSSAVPALLASLPIRKIGQLGGKLGHALETDLGVKTAGDLLQYSESKLQSLYGSNTGTWLWRIARGISGDEVQERTLPKSHSSGKTFSGPAALKDHNSVSYWLKQLAEMLQERLDLDMQQNHRSARLLTLHAVCHMQSSHSNAGRKFPSKSCALRYGKDKIVEDACILFDRGLKEYCSAVPHLSTKQRVWSVNGLSITASNIVSLPAGVDRITRFFSSAPNVDSEVLSNTAAENPANDCGLIEEADFQTDCDGHFRNEGEEASSCHEVLASVFPNDAFHQRENKDNFKGERDLEAEDTQELNATVGSEVWNMQMQERDNLESARDVEGTPSMKQEGQPVGTTQHEFRPNSILCKPNKTQGSLKLKDLWERKEINSSSLLPQYEKIDENVLSELPLEIQLEIREMYQQKQLPKTKRSKIEDFFKNPNPNYKKGE